MHVQRLIDTIILKVLRQRLEELKQRKDKDREQDVKNLKGKIKRYAKKINTSY